MNVIQMAVAALSSEPLGAPNVVTISDDSSFGNNGKAAGFVFNSNGTFSRYQSGVPIVRSNWLTPQTNMSDYEIRATLTGGDSPDGTFDVWTALGTSQEWTLQDSSPDDTLSGTILIEIRWSGNDVVQDSATYTITAAGPVS